MITSDNVKAVLRMAQVAVKQRDPALVRRDQQTGGWVQRYRNGVLVSPRLRGAGFKFAQRSTHDIFLHGLTVNSGDTVVELGAEYGTETVVLSRLAGPTGRIIAVEAHPWTYSLLRRTVELNKLTNVTTVHAAAVGRPGSVVIEDGHAGSTLSHSVVNGGHGISVDGITLDDLVDRFQLSRIDLLKVNIEGAEGAIFDGATHAGKLIRQAVISCHDFRADRGDGEAFRTSEEVDEAIAARGWAVKRRPHDPRPWVRDYRYVTAS